MKLMLVAVLLFPYSLVIGLDAYTSPVSKCPTCKGINCLSNETITMGDCSKDILELPDKIEELIDHSGKNAHYMCITFHYIITEFRTCILTGTDDVCSRLQDITKDCKLTKPEESDQTTTAQPTSSATPTHKPTAEPVTTHAPTTKPKTSTVVSTSEASSSTHSSTVITTAGPVTTHVPTPKPKTSTVVSTSQPSSSTHSSTVTTTAKPVTTHVPTSKPETSTVVSTTQPGPSTNKPVSSTTTDPAISTQEDSTSTSVSSTEQNSVSGSDAGYPAVVSLYFFAMITIIFWV